MNTIYAKLSDHQKGIFDEAQEILRTPSDDWLPSETATVLDMIAIHDEHDTKPAPELDEADKLEMILNDIEGIEGLS